MSKFKRGYVNTIVLIFLLISLTTSLVYHMNSKADSTSNISVTKDTPTDYASIKRDTSISVDSNGVLQIGRTKRNKEIPMGKDNSWTLFIYLTGSNLESKYQGASNDIKEILSANITPENVQNLNIIIQTGGSRKWHSNNISNGVIQRYKVNANSDSLTLLEECGDENMGNPNTLYDFLDWGVKNYPAKHMGVIFWDHGSGVSNGVCADEKYENDTLTVHELEYVFAKINKKMTSKFEMISFDTCLSGSLEYANILAPYAKYMIASADLEPGDGWQYTEGINFLLEHPDASGAEFGKVICDAYANYYEKKSQGQVRPYSYTLATYDLSKADKACIETNYLAKYLYDKIMADEDEFWPLNSFRSTRLRYSTDNLDIGSIINYFETSTKYDYDTTYFKKAIDDLVIYNKISDRYTKQNAKGITIYLPYSSVNLHTLNNYRNICFSPYWLKYMEWMVERNFLNDMSKYKATNWESSPYFFESDFNFINYDIIDNITNNINSTEDINAVVKDKLNSNPAYNRDGFPNTWYSNLTAKDTPTKNTMPSINKNIKINNNLDATIPHNELNTIKSVYNSVFTTMDNSLVCLGENNKVNYNSKTGKIYSSFNGEWFMLPDGQLLTAYIISQDKNTTVYSFPVMIYDEESSIRVEETVDSKGNTSYTTLGVWDSSNSKYSTDTFTRSYLPLKAGTTITPIYDVFNLGKNTYETEYGEEYTISKSNEFKFLLGQLDDKEYSFAYEIEKYNETLNYSLLK